MKIDARSLRTYFLFQFLFLVIVSSLAQRAVTGLVIDSVGKPVSFAAVGIKFAKDSSLIKGVLCDENGRYEFKAIAAGRYFITTPRAGQSDIVSNIFEHDSAHNTQVPAIIYKSAALSLQEVAITTTKKTIEFKDGNIIVNVANSPLAAGNSLYDLLRSMPGVLVDGDNITLQGRGVSFLLDGRIQRTSGAQLTLLLKSINASEVEKLELITNPPAKYDAAGSGGLINIITSRAKTTGYSGSVLYSFSQGFYANNYGQAALNYKGEKISVFTNCNFNYSDYHKINTWTRKVSTDTSITELTQQYTEKEGDRFVSLWGGFDYDPNKKNSLSIRYALRPGKNLITRNSRTEISNNDLGYTALQMNFEKYNTWFYMDYNLAYEHRFDTLGTKLSVNADYSLYPDQYSYHYKNYFLNDDLTQSLSPRYFTTDNRLVLHLFSCNADYEKKLAKKITLYTGVKVSQQQMNSRFVFNNLNLLTNEYTIDSSLSNQFRYKELLPAGYAEITGSIKKFSSRIGVRGEQTLINAQSADGSVSYNRTYFNLFPTASIDYNVSEKHNWQVSYNRRINRADYNNFNPFKQFRSMLTYVQGNPYLQPQYTNNMQFRHVYKGRITNTLEFSEMRNYFFTYNIENKATKELLFYNGNLNRASIYSYNLFFQQDFFKRWNCSFGLGVHYFYCKGLVNTVNYSNQFINSNFYTNNQITINRSTKLEIGGWMVGPWMDGVATYKPRGSLNVGVNKTLLKEKLILILSIQDVLFTQPVTSVIDYTGQYSTAKHRWDSRRVQINIEYNFGKIKVQEKSLKENEEKSRLGK